MLVLWYILGFLNSSSIGMVRREIPKSPKPNSQKRFYPLFSDGSTNDFFSKHGFVQYSFYEMNYIIDKSLEFIESHQYETKNKQNPGFRQDDYHVQKHLVLNDLRHFKTYMAKNVETLKENNTDILFLGWIPDEPHRENEPTYRQEYLMEENQSGPLNTHIILHAENNSKNNTNTIVLKTLSINPFSSNTFLNFEGAKDVFVKELFLCCKKMGYVLSYEELYQNSRWFLDFHINS